MQQLRIAALEMVGATDMPIGAAQLAQPSSSRRQERWLSQRRTEQLDLGEILHPNLRAGGGPAAHRHPLPRRRCCRLIGHGGACQARAHASAVLMIDGDCDRSAQAWSEVVCWNVLQQFTLALYSICTLDWLYTNRKRTDELSVPSFLTHANSLLSVALQIGNARVAADGVGRANIKAQRGVSNMNSRRLWKSATWPRWRELLERHGPGPWLHFGGRAVRRPICCQLCSSCIRLILSTTETGRAF
jgi:hypothetical protein